MTTHTYAIRLYFINKALKKTTERINNIYKRYINE